jgi:hypothetical protein
MVSSWTPLYSPGPMNRMMVVLEVQRMTRVHSHFHLQGFHAPVFKLLSTRVVASVHFEIENVEEMRINMYIGKGVNRDRFISEHFEEFERILIIFM